MLFGDVPFLDRFRESKRQGLRWVEFWWPDDPPAAVEAAARAAGVDVVLFNFDAGDMSAGDRGLMSDPERAETFRQNVPRALELAERLSCTRVNALVGVELPAVGRSVQLELAQENVAWAADLAAAVDVTIMIEAVNTYENGPYLLSSTEEAAAFVRSVGRPNVALQFDAYHMARMGEDVEASFAAHADEIGHVQIADCPGRAEPGTGEIAFDRFFRLLEESGYDGWVGLEYRPSAPGRDRFAWLTPYLDAGTATR